MQAEEASARYLTETDGRDAPLGYKRTEVGVIPEDWERRRLGDLATFRTGPFGSALHKADYIEGGVPLINPMHIVDGRLTPESATSISELAARRLAAYRFKSNDIVIGRRGDIGRCAVIRESYVGWVCGTGSLIIRSSGHADPEFLQVVLTTERVIGEIERASVGSTMTNLNQLALSRLWIQYPSKNEQRAIADALSDVDGLLGALDALIAKKRAIKQAAMQQLLTGKTRLPGFSGKWETKRLGDHVTFLRNGVNSRAELTVDGIVKYLHYGDIHTSNQVRLDPQAAAMPTLPEERARTLDRLRDGDLVFVDASEDLDGVGKSVEISRVSDIEVVAGLHTIAARFDKSVLGDGFKAYLQFCSAFRDQLRRLAAGTKVYATNRSHIASVNIPLPNVEEQTAIAAVLSDIDAEIAALEARRDKAKQIKQGMMQQLLTGRIRLVDRTNGPKAEA